MHKTLPLTRSGRAQPGATQRSGHRSRQPPGAVASLGYDPATLVEEPGQMSRRGGIIDIFPVTSPGPVRLEFFGDESTLCAASMRPLSARPAYSMQSR